MAQKQNITIAYYHCVKLPKVGYTHCQEMPYTQKTRETIVDTVLKSGYNVMIQQTGLPADSKMIIWIDNKTFKQR